MALEKSTDQLNEKGAAHLLRRATFGFTKQDIDNFAVLTPEAALDILFPATPLPDPTPPLDLKTGQEWVTTGPVDGVNSEEFDLGQYFNGWFISQMLNPSLAYSAREKIVFFLHTHFTAIQSKIENSRAVYFQNQLFRIFASRDTDDPELNIKALTVKLSVDNAMIRLLDGNLNVKGSVNENYARELLELYSIGRGLESDPKPDPPLAEGDYGVYTEDDVKAAARVLSGWTDDRDFTNIDPDTDLPMGKVKGTPTNASSHDNGSKTFSEHFGNNTIEPDPLLMPNGAATEKSALDEIRQLIDMIYENEETARNICRKIYRFFVGAPHDEGHLNEMKSAIEELVPILISNNYRIQPVIKELLCSKHFYELTIAKITSKGGLIKSPLDLVTGTLRFFEVKLPDMATDTANFYKTTTEILYLMGLQGMHFYEPFDVAGYDAYHQYPIYNRAWINTNSLSQRYIFIRELLNTSRDSELTLNSYDFINDNFNAEASNLTTLLNTFILYLLPHHVNDVTSLTTERLDYFKGRFLSFDFDESYWNSQWTNPHKNIAELKSWLDQLFSAVLQSPEYQLS